MRTLIQTLAIAAIFSATAFGNGSYSASQPPQAWVSLRGHSIPNDPSPEQENVAPSGSALRNCTTY